MLLDTLFSSLNLLVVIVDVAFLFFNLHVESWMNNCQGIASLSFGNVLCLD